MPRYKINAELNGIELYFDSKPESDIIELLKDNNWRWHRTKQCWYNRKSDTTLAFAKKLCDVAEQPKPIQKKQAVPFPVRKHSVSITQSVGTQIVGTVTITKDNGIFHAVSSNNMIICTDCRSFFSVHAAACPFCGCPIAHIVEQYYNQFGGKAAEEAEKAELQRREEEAQREALRKAIEQRQLQEAENRRLETLRKVKRQISPSDWKSEYEKYSIEQLLELPQKIDRNKRYDVYFSLPKEFVDYHRDLWLSFGKLSWSEIEDLQIEAEIYKEERRKILDRIESQAELQFDEACRILEAEKASKKKQSQSQAGLQSTAWKRCKKCGTPILGDVNFCSSCDPYKGLSSELQKLGTNTGAFNKQASDLAPYMRPVGVPKEDHRRFLDKLAKNEGFLPEPDYGQGLDETQTAETKKQKSIAFSVREEYRKKANRLMRTYPKNIVGRNKAAFYELAVALKICKENTQLEEYVNAYTLENYKKDDN